MVVFLDLEDEAEPPELQLGNGHAAHWMAHHDRGYAGVLRRLDINAGATESGTVNGIRNAGSGVRTEQKERDNPNKNLPITEALGCYPIIMSIASHIDLNTLDALSSTCRQVRVNLLQFRTKLISSTLHCENEDVELDPEHTFRYRARAADWYFVEGGIVGSGAGKFGDCARDMVGECRRCSKVVCRNCTIKPPAPVLLRHRHRRICKACSKAPLSSLISGLNTATPAQETPVKSNPIATEALKQKICACPTEGVWLCQPCGRSLRSADNEYESIWKWRTRYLPSLGGLGVGIGEGNRGVPCGRGGECIAAREVESEIDCDAEDAREIDSNSRDASPASSPGSANGSISSERSGQMGPGYARHEIEGIGGVVKKKLVRMVRVGACVPEWGDEKDVGKFLVREQEGRARSWCGWCWRVVPGAKDIMD
ncbi:hypothetical protein ONS95_003062 [Cadophora gregata]|uniref:uncharacterized protein n=1 Tax=Cadophora gregata TaxID=51156 RepID=UPI0026DBA823|nr:uncharacterized protein ONS95_003062 [Cadophora gregata]KAK0108243.1 hypothetical protein ONS95_003062 [Cadophora gregata]